MNFKKTLTLCMAAVLALSLIACGTTKPEGETGTGTTESKPANKPTGSTPSTDKPNADKPGETGAVTTPTVEDKSISIVDNQHCTVTITSVDADNKLGYTLNVFLENKTDKELMYSVEAVSVNGFMIDPFWAATVASGKKANETITFSGADFEKNGITQVSEISFKLKVYDNGDWNAEHLVSETFTIEL